MSLNLLKNGLNASLLNASALPSHTTRVTHLGVPLDCHYARRPNPLLRSILHFSYPLINLSPLLFIVVSNSSPSGHTIRWIICQHSRIQIQMNWILSSIISSFSFWGAISHHPYKVTFIQENCVSDDRTIHYPHRWPFTTLLSLSGSLRALNHKIH